MWLWIIDLINDASFIGSLLGALLSGLVAIFVLAMGIKHQNNLLKKAELGIFLKDARYLSNSLASLIGSIKQYVIYQHEEESITDRITSNGFPTEAITDIKFAKEILQKDIEDSLIGIRSVDRNAFDYDSFEIFIKIINNCEGQIEYYWKRSMKNEVDGVADILEESNTELETLKNSLDKLIEEAKKTYKKLK